jgi:hypothetical protein
MTSDLFMLRRCHQIIWFRHGKQQDMMSFVRLERRRCVSNKGYHTNKEKYADILISRFPDNEQTSAFFADHSRVITGS